MKHTSRIGAYHIVSASALISVFLLSILISLVHKTNGAIAASHSHIRNHDDRSPSREREADGAFSPR